MTFYGFILTFAGIIGGVKILGKLIDKNKNNNKEEKK